VAIKPIEILINAKDNASSAFLSLKATVIAVGTTIATYFGVSAFVGVVKGAGDFEAAMSRVKAATNASAEEMAKLTKLAKDAAAESGFSNVETADALTNLAKAGANATEAMEALPGVINLAKAGEVDLAQSSEYLTKIIAAMGGKFSDAGKYADVLAMGANASNTSVTGLAEALSYAAPAAKALGLSLETTVGLIGKFADSGIDAGRAGTALNSILSQFLDPASKFRNELALAGITTSNFKDALTQLAAAGPRGANAILAVGMEAGPALRGLLNAGIGALDELIGKLQNAEGSAAATAKTLRDNLNGSLSSLSNAWKAVTDVLGTPVLPVLKQGVDELTAAFKRAVDDGTVLRFGESIATAMRNGIQFIREFISTVDFGAVIVRLQDFADKTNENLTKVGEYATNAGNGLKLVWGVMTAGVDGAMVVIYKAGELITLQLSRIQLGAATLLDVFAKITFGDLSARYKAAADEIRLSAEATAAASEALGKKAKQALDDAAKGAELAREGWDGVTKAMSETEKQSVRTSAAMAKIAEELGKGAQAAADYGVAAQKKANADALASIAAADHAEKVEQLEKRYAELKASGNINEAIKVADELAKTLRQGALSAKEYAEQLAKTAAEVEAAFKQMGIQSSAALKAQADLSELNYGKIRASGLATAEDLSNAFRKAAEDAILANKGLAPSWVEAEAAARGYRIVVDASGKATLELANKTDDATGRMSRGWNVAREAIQANSDALEEINMRYRLTADYTERQIALLEREAAAAEKAADAKRKYWNVDKDGFTLDANGQRQQMTAPTGEFVFNAAKNAGLSEADALALMDKYFQNGKPTGVNDANGLNGPSKDWFSIVAEAISKLVIEKARQNVANPTGGSNTTGSSTTTDTTRPGPAGGGSGSGSGMSSGVSINLYPGVDFSSRAEAERLARFLAPAIKDLQRKGAI
jgi:TP901 family phage tail tape measure protein